MDPDTIAPALIRAAAQLAIEKGLSSEAAAVAIYCSEFVNEQQHYGEKQIIEWLHEGKVEPWLIKQAAIESPNVEAMIERMTEEVLR